MIELKLTSDEVALSKQLIEQRKMKLPDERLNSMEVKKSVIKELANCVYGKLFNIDIACDSDKLNSDSSDINNCFCTAYATAILMGYFQSLNTDREVDEDSIQEFGFSGLGDDFSIVCISTLGEILGADLAETNIEAGLHIKLRDISAEEYVAQFLYKDDLKVLHDILLFNIDDGYNKTVLKSVEKIYMSEIKAALADLESIYRVLFEDSFGIHPYEGVYADDGFYKVDEQTNKAKKITDGITVLTDLSSRIKKKLGTSVFVSGARQFDYDEIYSKKNAVYFPFKMLEYASGRELSLNRNTKDYNFDANNGADWSNYWQNYLCDNLEKILIRGYYKALERILLQSNSISSEFSSQKYLLIEEEKIQEFALANINETKKMINKLLNSMRLAYLLTSYPYIGGQITAIHLRFSDLDSYSCFDKSDNGYLFRNLVNNNDEEVFLDAYYLNDGETSGVGKVLSAKIYEYQYDINPMLAQAEPLFGYTIQKQNQKKGIKASWEKILIGESMSGKELYAARDSQIKLQNQFVHNIIAGSRSGKGVMTMNILASAIAAGKPIFYLDRKPDMAVMLYELSGGKQFIVNGGLYDPKNDDQGFFTDTGAALDGWEKTKNYLSQNPWVGELFNSQNGTYQGTVLGDYIYFRAAMFCLGLCVLRSSLKVDDPLLSKFNGKNGIVIVFDELTGYQNSIASILANISSILVKKAVAVGDTDSLIRKRESILRQIEVEETKISEAKKESAVLVSRNKIADLNGQLEALIDKQAVYSATFFSKIRRSYDILKSKKVAGFENQEFNFSDIFVLGQDLKPPYYSSGGSVSSKGSVSPVFFPVKSDGSDYYAGYKGADIIRSFLEELGCSDWFLGRNPQYPIYGDKNYNPAAKKVCDEDGNWEYIPGRNSCYEVNGVEAKELHSVLFKPYLVLNKNRESFTSSDGDFTFVAQCRDRVNTTAGGLDLWKDVRVKHLTSDAKAEYSSSNLKEDCLDPGIGFEGLVDYTLHTDPSNSNVGDISVVIQNALGQSGDLANIVANEMGYSNWRDLIFDLSPQGLFSFEDMVNAVTNKSDYTLENRLPIYAKLGLLSKDNEESLGYEDSDEDFDFSNVTATDNNNYDDEEDATQSYNTTPEESFEEQEDYTPENDETGFFSDNYEDNEEDYDDYDEDESSVSDNQHTQVQDELKIMDTNEFCNWVSSEAYKVGITSAEGVLMLINKCMNYITSQGIVLG